MTILRKKVGIGVSATRLLCRYEMEGMPETIVGSIQDEYDSPPGHLYEIAPGRFVEGCNVTMKRLSDTLKTGIPADDRSLDLWLRAHHPTRYFSSLRGRIRAQSSAGPQ